MSVHIRLKRIGKNPKKNPHFRIAVFNRTAGRDAGFIEELGYYMPSTGTVKIDRAQYEAWVKKGARPSETVTSLVKKSLKEEKNAAKPSTDK